MTLIVTLTKWELAGLIVGLIVAGAIIGMFATALLSANHPRR